MTRSARKACRCRFVTLKRVRNLGSTIVVVLVAILNTDVALFLLEKSTDN